MTSCFQSPISRDIPRRHHIALPVDTTSHYLSTLPRPTCQHHLLPKSGNPCDMHYLSATLPRTISHHTDTTTVTTCHLHYLPLALPRTTSPACQHHLPHSHYLSTPPPATRTTPHHPDTTPRHYLSTPPRPTPAPPGDTTSHYPSTHPPAPALPVRTIRVIAAYLARHHCPLCIGLFIDAPRVARLCPPLPVVITRRARRHSLARRRRRLPTAFRLARVLCLARRRRSFAHRRLPVSAPPSSPSSSRSLVVVCLSLSLLLVVSSPSTRVCVCRPLSPSRPAFADDSRVRPLPFPRPSSSLPPAARARPRPSPYPLPPPRLSLRHQSSFPSACSRRALCPLERSGASFVPSSPTPVPRPSPND